MRILLAGPPKTGNVWMENILAEIYKLTILVPPNVPDRSLPSFRQFLYSGTFLDNTIVHQHLEPTEELFTFCALVPCHVVTMIRHPYDMFVSLFYYVSNFREAFERAGHDAVIMADKPISHPDVVSYLEHGFGWFLDLASEWGRRTESLIVRYEDLHRDTFGVTKAPTERILPTHDAIIWRAIEASKADVMRTRSVHLAKHIRSATVGGWATQLNEQHLTIFRQRHAHLVAALGYEVY